MEPVLLGRTVRFHPCLQRKEGRQTGGRNALVPRMWARVQLYLEKGSDFPTGNPLPCVLVSTLPQCTATWQSFSSTNRQYSCCGERRAVSLRRAQATERSAAQQWGRARPAGGPSRGGDAPEPLRAGPSAERGPDGHLHAESTAAPLTTATCGSHRGSAGGWEPEVERPLTDNCSTFRGREV